jgi:release factor glutamine methyltransferase
MRRPTDPNPPAAEAGLRRPSFAGLAPAAAVGEAARALAAGGTPSPRAEAETLLTALLGVDRAGLYVRRTPLDPREAAAFAALVERRLAGAPVQHLTGRQWFLGLDLEVEPGVFVPRPETEGLALAALEAIADRERPTVIDVGTGTGAVALAVAEARPDARVVGTDLSEAAVGLARRNADRLGIPIDVRVGDLLLPAPEDLRGHLDLIVSNPPYVDPEDYGGLPADVRADPTRALVGGTTVHRRLAEAAPIWLAPGGWLVVEIGDEQGSEVRAMFERTLVDVRTVTDLAGRDRIVAGRRAET